MHLFNMKTSGCVNPTYTSVFSHKTQVQRQTVIHTVLVLPHNCGNFTPLHIIMVIT